METIKPETNCSEMPNNSDCISRQAAIEVVKHAWAKGLEPTQYLEELPSAEPPYNPDEWCHDCKEYDQERHCCPRWNRVIRKTVDELRAEQAERREE